MAAAVRKKNPPAPKWRYLLIVESPGKIKSLSRILGPEYKVSASLGHIRDLPKSRLAIDIEKNFSPEYIIPPAKKKVAKELKAEAEVAEEVYLAPDPDREGEAIAWHLAELLMDAGKPLRRVTYQEITPRAVREALAHPGRIDQGKVDAQTARRVMDRLMGYKLSPLLWKKVASGLSAGRVQSVALLLVCAREDEIEAFVSEEYWLLDALLARGAAGRFWARLEKIDGKKARVASAAEAEAIENEIRTGEFRVAGIEEKERRKAPPLPFITSSLQLEAARRFRWSVAQTMRVAQSLYEGVELGERGAVGLITYMRTDSYRLSREALDEIRSLIRKDFGDDYLPEAPRVFRARRGAQDAHEAVRVTDPALAPDQVGRFLDADQLRLYSLIWRRTLACQMTPARVGTVTVRIDVARYGFVARREKVLFPGYLRVWEGVEENGQDPLAPGEETPLPPLQEGDLLDLEELKKEQKFTQPPARYTEGTLVKALEANGVGRPSTYAPTVGTLLKRNYAEKRERKLFPTMLGRVVNRLLQEHFASVINAEFTASMEAELDAIAEGKLTWEKVVGDFYTPFVATLEGAEKEMADLKRVSIPTEVPCPNCGKKMSVRWGRNGQYLACPDYPACRGTMNFERDEAGNIRPRQPRESSEICGECGAPMVIRSGRFGEFLSCSKYPECRHKRPLPTGVKCPREGCAGQLVSRRSKKGSRFYGCSRYPECDYLTRRLPKPPSESEDEIDSSES